MDLNRRFFMCYNSCLVLHHVKNFFGVLEMLGCYNPCVVSLIGGASSEMFFATMLW
jgi:hypothetical protein